MNQKKTIIKSFLSKFKRKWSIIKILKEFSRLADRIFKNLRNIGSILRRSVIWRKKVDEEDLRWIWECWKKIIPYQHSIFKRN